MYTDNSGLSQRPRTLADLEMWAAMGDRHLVARMVHILHRDGIPVEAIAASKAGLTVERVNDILSRPAPV